MNAKQRKQVEQIISKLSEIQTEIEGLRDEEQDKYDGMPDGLQESERGCAIQEAADQLDYAADSVQDAIDNLTDID